MKRIRNLLGKQDKDILEDKNTKSNDNEDTKHDIFIRFEIKISTVIEKIFWSRNEEQHSEHDENPSKDENDDDTKNDKFNKIINKIFKIRNRIETKFLPHSEVNQLESESLPLADINLMLKRKMIILRKNG
ncbi:unnamed protein product [Rhizophagus irregularis]|nr:unnamed protein product [Rhizophagus irregularis]